MPRSAPPSGPPKRPMRDFAIDAQLETTKRPLKRPFNILQHGADDATISNQGKTSRPATNYSIQNLSSLKRLVSNKENLTPWLRTVARSTVPLASSSPGEARTAPAVHSPSKRRHSVLESETEPPSRSAKRLSLPTPFQNTTLQRKVTPFRDWVKKKTLPVRHEMELVRSTPNMAFEEPIRSLQKDEDQPTWPPPAPSPHPLHVPQPRVVNPKTLWLTRTPNSSSSTRYVGFRWSAPQVPGSAWATTCRPRLIYWKPG